MIALVDAAPFVSKDSLSGSPHAHARMSNGTVPVYIDAPLWQDTPPVPVLSVAVAPPPPAAVARQPRRVCTECATTVCVGSNGLCGACFTVRTERTEDEEIEYQMRKQAEKMRAEMRKSSWIL